MASRKDMREAEFQRDRAEAMRAQSDMQRRQLRMDADGTIHEGRKVRLEGEGIQAVSEANLSAQAQRNAVEHDARETRAQANGAGRGAICQLIAAYVRALEGISYREWGIVVDIMEHAFERRQREYMLDLRFDADDEVAKEIMRAGAAR